MTIETTFGISIQTKPQASKWRVSSPLGPFTEAWHSKHGLANFPNGFQDVDLPRAKMIFLGCKVADLGSLRRKTPLVMCPRSRYIYKYT
jgi:hypothetical protein